MSSPTKSGAVAPTSYSIKPQSITLDAFNELIRRLNVIMREVSQIKVDKGGDASRLNDRRKQLLMKVSTYLRDVKTAQLLLHLSPEACDFDDHDQVASSVLYRFNQYEHVRDRSNPTNRGLVDNFVVDWSKLLSIGKHLVADSVEHHKLRSSMPVNFSAFTSLKVGILTVLEHEYQSVVRRLDRIYACSGEYAYGYAIRYRTHPTEDLKDLLTDYKNMGIVGSLDLGWTIGSVGSEMVVVICTGDMGKDNTSKSIDYIQNHLKLLVENWLDVGVCAGTDKNWPIGTVLVSKGRVIDLRRTGSDRFEKEDVITPLSISLPESGKFPLLTSYRRVPQMRKISVANPTDIPIFSVTFACPREVIRLTHDREAIRRYLVEEGYLKLNEEFGIEMEGAGTTLHSESSTMCIIKGVCDYGDNSKKSWPSGSKVLFQLYAAETAADYAISLVKDWHNHVESRKVAPPA